VRWISVFCLAIFSGFAQQPEPSDRKMTLAVVVTDKSGKPVSGLEESDFKLLDNKQPQKILSFSAVQGSAPGAPPVEAILLIDEVNTAFVRVSYARQQVEKFLKQDDGKLPIPVSLAVLTDQGITLGNMPTTDGNALADALDQNKAGLRSINRAQGVYGAGDRLTLSLNALHQLAMAVAGKPGRKLVIWLSPGWPLLTGPRIELSGKDQKNIFGQIVDLSNTLWRSGVTISSIDPLGTSDAGRGETFYYEEFVKGIKKPNQVQFGNLALQVLAVQSGGEVLNSSNDVSSEIAKAIALGTAYYMLTFDGLPGDGPDEYHALEVKLDKSGLTAHTRTGYYAQPGH
jgi:VWFA-related protein